MENKELKPNTPDGLVVKILNIEAEEAKAKAVAKELGNQADELRAELLEVMNKAGMKTLKHQNGMRVTVNETAKIKVLDMDEFIADLKDKKLVNFIQEREQVIVPAAETVDPTLFKTYFKSSAWKDNDFKGIEITRDQHLTIVKP